MLTQKKSYQMEHSRRNSPEKTDCQTFTSNYLMCPMNTNIFATGGSIVDACSKQVLKKFIFTHRSSCSNLPLSYQNVRPQSTGDDDSTGDSKQKSPLLFTSKIFPIFHSDKRVSLRDTIDVLTMSDLSTSYWCSSFCEVIERADATVEFRARHRRYCDVAARKVERFLRLNQKVYLGGFFRHFVEFALVDELLSLLDRIACESVGEESGSGGQRPDVCARALACVADALEAVSPGHTLLRSGPSLNRQWKTAIDSLNAGHLSRGVRELAEVRAAWLHNDMLVIRAARHYEGAAQVLIRQAVMTVSARVKPFLSRQAPVASAAGRWLVAEAPARVDFSGGWTDTPPICYEHGGVVVNAAVLIEKKRPIGARVRRIAEPVVVFRLLGREKFTTQTVRCTSLADLADYAKPRSPGALLKACVVLAQLVSLEGAPLAEQLLATFKGGLELHTWSDLPQGSGLGTSSILAGAVLKVLFAAIGVEMDARSLVYGVLMLEQMLTTGGGWQDQVGGMIGGIKVGRSPVGLPLEVVTEQIGCSPAFVRELNARLKLVYTGKTRLARNLLQNVLRNWYGKSAGVLENCERLVANAERCAAAFRAEDMAAVGACVGRYWSQKKVMAPGSEPVLCTRLLETFEPIAHGASLAGAGGGGFMYVLLKEAMPKERVQSLIGELAGADDVEVFDVEVDNVGLVYYERRFEEN